MRFSRVGMLGGLSLAVSSMLVGTVGNGFGVAPCQWAVQHLDHLVQQQLHDHEAVQVAGSSRPRQGGGDPAGHGELDV